MSVKVIITNIESANEPSRRYRLVCPRMHFQQKRNRVKIDSFNNLRFVLQADLKRELNLSDIIVTFDSVAFTHQASRRTLCHRFHQALPFEKLNNILIKFVK